MVLLALLRALGSRGAFRLSALHVNHQIHPEADRWQQFCVQFCHEQGIPCTVERVILDREPGESLEAVARGARYAAYARQTADFIVLAHHQDDQAETLLIQLLRGAGLPGLCAMPETRPLHSCPDSPRLLRPLLQVPRRDLHACAEAFQLRWIDDPSNDQRVHVRNFLRHAVAPVLGERFPSWTATLGRTARHLAQAQEMLDALAQQDFATCGDASGIRVSAALMLGEVRVTNLLRWWLRQQGAPACHEAQLQEWLRQAHAAPDRMPKLVWGGWVLNRFAGAWQLHRAVAGQWAALTLANWPEDGISIPGAGRLIQEPVIGAGIRRVLLAQGEVTLRRRRGGEQLRPRSGGPTRTLRHLFQEAALPPWWRDALPLVFVGEDLICVPGVAVAVAAQAGPGEPGLHLRWEPFVPDAAHW
ncbi:MAG: tRNA lysidine(34) synthetase TilS [Ferrovum sp.]|nr:tRNA lysidine(34) synthetase TilS [Ferrovum sp.]